jgi:predicted RNA-binding Zn-ribbon protein involved in translation (DUF1610 family)
MMKLVPPAFSQHSLLSIMHVLSGEPVMRRFYRAESVLSLSAPLWIWFAMILIMIELMAPGTIALWRLLGWSAAMLFPFFVASMVLGFVGSAKLERNDFMYCPFCRYNIADVAPKAREHEVEFRCPECGSSLTRSLVERLWQEGYSGESIEQQGE